MRKGERNVGEELELIAHHVLQVFKVCGGRKENIHS